MSPFDVFLETQLTRIPKFLEKYLGNYYNNRLCNGATSMFIIWFILHVLFRDVLNGLLRRMKFKHYVRTRLMKSLWYLGFYSTALVYSAATLLRNDIKFASVNEPFDDFHGTSSPYGHLIFGFIVILTFYMHSMLWEKVNHDDTILALIYFSLSILMCVGYFLRFVQGIFRLTILICSTQIVIELARCAALTGSGAFKGAMVTRTLFIASLGAFTLNYLILIPLLLGYPLLKTLSPSGFFQWVCLVVWLIQEIYSSVLFKFISHWVDHDDTKCIYECSLFSPRSDATYNYCILKKEMQERQAQTASLRKPNTRNMVFQTLKCMVAIKKKLNDKRQGANNLDDNRSAEEDAASNDVVKGASEEEIVGGRLQFNINSKGGEERKLKKE